MHKYVGCNSQMQVAQEHKIQTMPLIMQAAFGRCVLLLLAHKLVLPLNLKLMLAVWFCYQLVHDNTWSTCTYCMVVITFCNLCLYLFLCQLVHYFCCLHRGTHCNLHCVVVIYIFISNFTIFTTEVIRLNSKWMCINCELHAPYPNWCCIPTAIKIPRGGIGRNVLIC